METIILTRFSIHQQGWTARPTSDWLEHRWPFFKKTAEAVAKQSVPVRWMVICHESTPENWLSRLAELAEVVLVSKHWLAAVQDAMPEGPKLTIRLDSDDIIAPSYCEAMQDLAAILEPPHFICMREGYQFDGTDYYKHAETNGPFLGFVERGSDTVYCRAHGNALNKEKVSHLLQRRYIQVIHDKNLRNKIRGEKCEPPTWA